MERSEQRAEVSGVDERTESIYEWLYGHSRVFAIAAVVVVLALGGVALRSRYLVGQEAQGQKALQTAQQSLVQGNTPLAQTDLQRLISTRKGTAAASQGAMLLAQLYYQQGQYQKGIDALQNSNAAAKEFSAPVEALIADGYSQLGRPADAASHYRRAAEETRFKADREDYLANAARSLVVAKDTAAARQIWQDLASDDASNIAAEARIRLGELSARPAPKS